MNSTTDPVPFGKSNFSLVVVVVLSLLTSGPCQAGQVSSGQRFSVYIQVMQVRSVQVTGLVLTFRASCHGQNIWCKPISVCLTEKQHIHCFDFIFCFFLSSFLKHF